MESKHTPGPWRAGRLDMQSYLANGLPVHYVYRGDAETAESRIMVTPYPGEGSGDPTDDALVMAAAPEMLEILRDAVDGNSGWTARADALIERLSHDR